MFWRKTQSILVKGSLIVEEDLAISALHRNARELLGYRSGPDPIENEIRREVQSKLNDLGYDCLVSEKVEAYQISKLPIREKTFLIVHWKPIEIAEYRDPIPEFALSKAVELKTVFPAARFFVEEFDRGPDPFLVMFYRGLKFYVEVWDEPAFEGRKIVADSRRDNR